MVPELTFPVTLTGHVPVVTTPEEIDLTNAEELRTALLQAAHMHRVTVVDLSQTRFCDSAGLHALANAHKRAHDQDGELMLVVTDAAVRRILTLTGIDRLIPHFATLDEAIASTATVITDGPGPGQRLARGPAETVLEKRCPLAADSSPFCRQLIDVLKQQSRRRVAVDTKRSSEARYQSGQRVGLTPKIQTTPKRPVSIPWGGAAGPSRRAAMSSPSANRLSLA